MNAHSQTMMLIATVPFSGGPDNLLSGRAQRAGSDKKISEDGKAASCRLRRPGQQVVRATPDLEASSHANFALVPKLHFALNFPDSIVLRSARELPQQSRSQMEFGNEGNTAYFTDSKL
jgi:allantoicase